MADEQRAVVGDSTTVGPVPLVLFWTRLTTRKEKNPYFVSYIQRPNWLWQTNSVPFLETAPPWDQFHLSCSGPVSQQEKRIIPTSSRTSRDPAGYGKRTACHYWRLPRRGTCSTCLVLDLSHNKKREKSLLRLVHPQT
jgi:hypothetical protein